LFKTWGLLRKLLIVKFVSEKLLENSKQKHIPEMTDRPTCFKPWLLFEKHIKQIMKPGIEVVVATKSSLFSKNISSKQSYTNSKPVEMPT
jgi:hypothetical protein